MHDEPREARPPQADGDTWTWIARDPTDRADGVQSPDRLDAAYVVSSEPLTRGDRRMWEAAGDGEDWCLVPSRLFEALMPVELHMAPGWGPVRVPGGYLETHSMPVRDRAPASMTRRPDGSFDPAGRVVG